MLSYILLIWNVVVLLMYFIDKKRSINDQWRIKEKTLMLSGLLLGGVGAFLGMYLFHHKTKHKWFSILMPISAVITIYVYLSIA